MSAITARLRPSPQPTRVSLSELIQLQAAARALPAATQRARAADAGWRVSAFKGRGMDFEESRPYQSGDDARFMDWRVTARTGKAYVKVFREERERPRLLWVDYRAHMAFATRGNYKRVQAAHAAALLAWQALHSGDRVGGMIATDTGTIELPPKRGRSSLLQLLHRLAGLSEQAPPAPASGYNISPCSLLPLARVARPGTGVMILSDFQALDWQAPLSSLAGHDDITLVFIYDPLERQLPNATQLPLLAWNGMRVLLDGNPRAQGDYQARFAARVAALKQFCQQHQAGLILLPTNISAISALSGRRSGARPS